MDQFYAWLIKEIIQKKMVRKIRNNLRMIDTHDLLRKFKCKRKEKMSNLSVID
jgi:hypothetical protein